MESRMRARADPAARGAGERSERPARPPRPPRLPARTENTDDPTETSRYARPVRDRANVDAAPRPQRPSAANSATASSRVAASSTREPRRALPVTPSSPADPEPRSKYLRNEPSSSDRYARKNDPLSPLRSPPSKSEDRYARRKDPTSPPRSPALKPDDRYARRKDPASPPRSPAPKAEDRYARRKDPVSPPRSPAPKPEDRYARKNDPISSPVHSPENLPKTTNDGSPEFRLSKLLPSTLRRPKPGGTPLDRNDSTSDKYGLSSRLGLNSPKRTEPRALNSPRIGSPPPASTVSVTDPSTRNNTTSRDNTIGRDNSSIRDTYIPYPPDAPTLRRDGNNARNISPALKPISARQGLDSNSDVKVFNGPDPNRPSSPTSRRPIPSDALSSVISSRRRGAGSTRDGEDMTSILSGESRTIGVRSGSSVDMNEYNSPDAVNEALRYKVLRPSDVDRYKNELQSLRTKSESLTGKLAIEIKAKESASSTLKSSRGDPDDARRAKDSILSATERIERVIAELLKHTKRASDLEKRLLQSTAGTLARALRQVGKLGQDAQTGGSDSTREKIGVLEAKIKTLTLEIEKEQDYAESKIKLADKYAKQVDGLTLQLEEELEKALDRDRVIASLRTEIEETTVKLEFLQTKHGVEQSPTRGTTERSRQKYLRDFASDSGVEPFDDGTSTGNNMAAGSSETTLRATIRELREEINRVKGRNAALEAELTDAPDPRKNPDLRPGVNASMREAILERERYKEELEEERAHRRDLERKLDDLEISSKINKPSPRLDPGGITAEDARVLREFYHAEFPAIAARQKFSVENLISEITNRLQSANSNEFEHVKLSRDQSRQLERLQETLDEREAEFSKLSRDQSRKVEKLQIALDARESEFEKLSKEQSRQLQRLEETLDEREAEYTKVSREQSRQVERLQAALDSRDSPRQVERLEQTLDAREAEYAKASREQARQLELLQEKLDARENEYANISKEELSQVEKLNATLDLREAEFAKKSRDQSRQMEKLQATLDEREAELSQMSRDQSRQMEKLQASLAEREADFNKANKDQSRQMDRLAATLDAREADIRSLEDQLNKKAREIDNLNRQLVDLKASYDLIEEERANDQRRLESRFKETLEEETAALENKLRSKDRELGEIRAEIQSLHDIQDQMEHDHAEEIRAVQKPLQEQVDSLNRELEDRITSQERLQQSYDRLKNSHTEELQDLVETHNLKVQKLSNELQEALNNLDEEVLERKRQVRELNEKMADLQHRYEDDMAAYERELSSVQNETDSQVTKVDAFNRQIAVLEDDKASLKEQLARLAEARETERVDFEQTIEGLRTKLGDAEGIDFEQHRALQEQVIAMEDQLVLTFDKFAQREDTLSTELEKMQKREERLQEDYEGLNKEFERIAMNFTDFDHERKKYEKTIDDQRLEVAKYKAEVEEMTVNKIGQDEVNPTVVSLRKEFRKILSDIREEYSTKFAREIEAKTELERTIRGLKRERDMEVYHKSSASVQTMALYTEKPDYSSPSAFVSKDRS